MNELINTGFTVLAPDGRRVRVGLAISAPVLTAQKQWEVATDCPAIPHASATFTGRDPLGAVCFAISQLRRFMRDEFSKGYAMEDGTPIGRFVEELFGDLAECEPEETPISSAPEDCDALLADLARLVGRYGGVTDANAWHNEGESTLWFCCVSAASLIRLTDVAAWANLGVTVVPRLGSRINGEVPGTERLPRFQVAIPDGPDVEGSAAAWLLFQMVGDLRAHDQIAREEADALLARWCGAAE